MCSMPSYDVSGLHRIFRSLANSVLQWKSQKFRYILPGVEQRAAIASLTFLTALLTQPSMQAAFMAARVHC